MTRSLGDAVAAQVGVISDPELMEFRLTEEDKFIVLASDGVWEFIENQECMEMIVPFW